MTASWQRELQPADLVQSALSESLGVFVALYSMTGFILVRLFGDHDELTVGLATTIVSAQDAVPVRPTLTVMSYSTALQDGQREPETDRAQPSEVFDEHGVRAELLEHRCFIVPLRKRSDVDAAFVDRISVGRARNKDIVLRHSSISKFHGWFQVDDTGGAYFADAGSRNGTRVGSVQLAPRVPCALTPGSKIRLGQIAATYCPTELLWRALRLA